MTHPNPKPVFLSKSQRQDRSLAAAPHLVSAAAAAAAPNDPPTLERRRDEELAAIKEQYLGTSHPKRRRLTLRSRFSPSWDPADDTTAPDASPLAPPPLLFGRGLLAGIDPRHQKKTLTLTRSTHWSLKPLDEMSERDWRIFLEDSDISIRGTHLPRPFRRWPESGLSPDLLSAIHRAGYDSPSPIQMAAIPVGLSNRDMIGVAETGSGKTAAFVLPMLHLISSLPPDDSVDTEGPHAVVLAPTRELALQIESETNKFARPMGVRVVSIVGGQSIQKQGFDVHRGCEVVIATPGRLLDCLERRYIVLNRCNFVVLDEADRMIDMGFEPQVVKILDAMPENGQVCRTTYMFSATMPPAVERLARKYLRNPVTVTVGSAGKATKLVTQHVIMLKESEKMSRLRRILDDIGENTAIVFVNTRRSADFLAKDLDKLGYRATTLHGGKMQEQREVNLESFRSKQCNVLVATDVAGRGIDIPGVAHVVNFDMPNKIEMYTHRIGRTGRAGNSGVATTFLTMQDADVFYDLKQTLVQSNSPVPPELARHEASKFRPGTIPERPRKRSDTVFAH